MNVLTKFHITHIKGIGNLDVTHKRELKCSLCIADSDRVGARQIGENNG